MGGGCYSKDHSNNGMLAFPILSPTPHIEEQGCRIISLYLRMMYEQNF